MSKKEGKIVGSAIQNAVSLPADFIERLAKFSEYDEYLAKHGKILMHWP
jgi:hypothetical protein